MLELPVVVGLEEDSADEADDRLLVWEDADDIGPPLDLFVEAFNGLVECNLVRCWLGKVM